MLAADKHVVDFLSMKTEIDSMKTQAAGNRLDQIHADLLALQKGDPERYNRLSAALLLALKKIP